MWAILKGLAKAALTSAAVKIAQTVAEKGAERILSELSRRFPFMRPRCCPECGAPR